MCDLQGTAPHSVTGKGYGNYSKYSGSMCKDGGSKQLFSWFCFFFPKRPHLHRVLWTAVSFGVCLLLAVAQLSTKQGCRVAVAVRVQLSVEPGRAGGRCAAVGAPPGWGAALQDKLHFSSAQSLWRLSQQYSLLYPDPCQRICEAKFECWLSMHSLFFGRFIWPQGWFFLCAIFSYFPLLHVRHPK